LLCPLQRWVTRCQHKRCSHACGIAQHSKPALSASACSGHDMLSATLLQVRFMVRRPMLVDDR
jgi:hypothetical protein